MTLSAGCARTEGGEVAKRHVRLGRRVVLHLLMQPVTEHDRGVLDVSGTGEEELPSRHRVVPAGDPDLVSAALLHRRMTSSGRLSWCAIARTVYRH
jgi:hypothetical protein